MRVECPNCFRITEISEDQILSRKKPFEIICSGCRQLLKLNILVQVKKDLRSQSSAKLPKVLKKDPIIAAQDSDRHLSIPVLKSRILRSLVNLPSMPHIILKAQEVMADPHASLKDLAGVIETDQAIVARVLTLANSAYYGISGMVSSIQHASVLLGQKTLGELITISASSGFLSKKLKGYGIGREDMWKHSLAAAFAAKLIAEKLEPDLTDDAFVAGLLHDAGKIILDPFVAGRREDFERYLGNGSKNFIQAEREILGIDHAEIMSRACRFWRFPENQTLAIRHHHSPTVAEEHELSYILHLADFLARSAGFVIGFSDPSNDLEAGTLEFLDLSQEDTADLELKVAESVQKIEKELQRV